MQYCLDNFIPPVPNVLTTKSLNGGKVEYLGCSLLDYDETPILKLTWQLVYALHQIFSNDFKHSKLSEKLPCHLFYVSNIS